MKRQLHVTLSLPEPTWAPICVHTHTGQRMAGVGGQQGGAPTRLQDGGSAGGCAGSELLFTAQSQSVVIATQPPNREMDITASRGGRAGGG